MKIYIEHEKEFYEYELGGADAWEDVKHYPGGQHFFSPCRPTDKRDFEIGARVYFENVGWTEVLAKLSDGSIECDQCALIRGTIGCDKFEKRIDCSEHGIYFKKLDLTEKQEEPKPIEQFYVLNIKTGVTNFIHESEASAKTEAERLAIKQPGDTFRVLKVVGECVGKVNVEWSGSCQK